VPCACAATGSASNASGALLVASGEIEKLDQDDKHIRTRMPPNGGELTNLLVAENVD
jgi:hypothetical protein